MKLKNLHPKCRFFCGCGKKERNICVYQKKVVILQPKVAKINYHIHTDAIKANLVPEEISQYHRSLIYANEADVLNVALFGMTAKEWRDAHPEDKGNIRDYATINQLICLSNMENLNAVFINEGLPQSERLQKLNQIAIQQMTVLENAENKRILKE